MNQSPKKKIILYSFLSALIMELYNSSNSLPAFVGLWIFFFSLMHLFDSFGEKLPLRILFLFFMSFQLLFTGYLAYFVYPEYQYYRMSVEPHEYFTYTIAAIGSFAIGLYWREKKNQHLEAVNITDVRAMAQSNPGIAYFFLSIGILASFADYIFTGLSVGFVLYALSLLKFVGLFLIILGSIELKKWLTIAIYSSIIITSFQEAMFHDLIIWSLFLFSVYSLKYQPSFSRKASIFITGVIIVLFIQVIKGTYRENLKESEASLDTVINTTGEVQEQSGGIFTIGNIAPQISRFNQGWIITRVLDNVPENEPFAEGETIKLYLEAAFLPRVWAPDKLQAGDKEIFSRYTGQRIFEGTSMALSSVGDAYINFGKIGGCVFLFVYGLLISLLMNFLSKKTKEYPFLPLFALVIFAYAVRIECEMQTVMGHIVKSCIILWVIFILYQRMLRRYFQPVRESRLQTSR